METTSLPALLTTERISLGDFLLTSISSSTMLSWTERTRVSFSGIWGWGSGSRLRMSTFAGGCRDCFLSISKRDRHGIRAFGERRAVGGILQPRQDKNKLTEEKT